MMLNQILEKNQCAKIKILFIVLWFKICLLGCIYILLNFLKKTCNVMQQPHQ